MASRSYFTKARDVDDLLKAREVQTLRRQFALEFTPKPDHLVSDPRRRVYLPPTGSIASQFVGGIWR